MIHGLVFLDLSSCASLMYSLDIQANSRICDISARGMNDAVLTRTEIGFEVGGLVVTPDIHLMHPDLDWQLFFRYRIYVACEYNIIP